MARVLLDARKIGDGGIGIYLDTLITGAHLLCRDGRLQHEFVLLVPPENSLSASPRKQATLARWRTMWECREEHAGKYSAAEYFLLARRHADTLKHADLFHAPHYTLPFFLTVPSIATVHDLIHLHQPTPRVKRSAARAMIRSALRRADAVITVSSQSRKEIEAAFPEAGKKVSVVPNGIPFGMRRAEPETVQRFRSESALDRPYCLYVGADKPHKGLPMLLEAWRRAQRCCPEMMLVLVGEQFSVETRELIRTLQLGSSVRFAGAVSTEQLSLLYSGAEAALVASSNEGFGLPALEALACGCRVVSTPLPSIAEICGTEAVFARDFSGEAFAAALVEASLNPAGRESARLQGPLRAQLFPAEQTVLRTARVYDGVLEQAAGQFRGQLTLGAREGKGQPNVWRSIPGTASADDGQQHERPSGRRAEQGRR